jgi:hypothetical protein
MRAHRYARLPIAALAALVLLILADAGAAWAQHRTFRASGMNRAQPSRGDGNYRTGKSSQRRGGRYRTGGRGHRRDGGQRSSDKGNRRDGGQRTSNKGPRRDGGQRTSNKGPRRDRGQYTSDNGHRRDAGHRTRGRLGPRTITAIPRTAPPHRRLSKGGTLSNTSRPTTLRPRNARRPGPSGAPPAGEHRFVADEVVIEIANSVSPQRVDALQRRFRLIRLERRAFQLTGTTLFRWRIPDRRSVASVVRALERDATAASVQPNYLFALQQTEATSEGDAAQYELAKLRLPQAHKLAKGDNVRVALIDSAVDLGNAEFAHSIAATFDTLASAPKPHKHGTAIAGLIAAHGRLMGAAPAAKLLAVRAFDSEAAGAQGTTFNILKGLDWAAANGARIVNMSFAGPADPMLHRSLQAAHESGIVLIAAAGNAGAKSPPLYPAAEPTPTTGCSRRPIAVAISHWPRPVTASWWRSPTATRCRPAPPIRRRKSAASPRCCLSATPRSRPTSCAGSCKRPPRTSDRAAGTANSAPAWSMPMRRSAPSRRRLPARRRRWCR